VRQRSQEPRRVILSVVCVSYSHVLLIAIVNGLFITSACKNRNERLNKWYRLCHKTDSRWESTTRFIH